MIRALPEGMLLGVASAAYQIEGAWNVADKSPSIWDIYSDIPGIIKDNTTAKDACKSYENYKRDIAMLNFLGVMFYRFSISWPRVLPNGFANKISKDGAAYYSNLIDELLANGIEPVVTMYHWDLPQSLQDLGGWANPMIADWFEDYARVLYDLYGHKVKKWVTLNEPKQICLFGYGASRFAPGLNAHGVGEYFCVKNALMAHAKAWHLYNKEYRSHQNGSIGITIATDHRGGMTDDPEDIQAGLDAMDFEVGLYSHPIFTDTGGFPKSVIRLIAEKSKQQGYPISRLPEFTKEDVEFVKGTSDFYGFNHYSSRFYTCKMYKEGLYPIPSYDDDLGAVWSLLDYEPAVLPHCTAIPHGIRKALNWVKDNCNDPPIMITENGFGTMGGLHDEERISYVFKYLNSILDAMEIDKCNVVCYTLWSVMDNFEWNSGLSIKFGIFEVDYEDDKRTRRARTSALWYRDLIQTRSLKTDFIPALEEVTF